MLHRFFITPKTPPNSFLLLPAPCSRFPIPDSRFPIPFYLDNVDGTFSSSSQSFSL
ncbi:MAG: hypothetical protein F6K65_18925 [Moorea sp. SIO3C2]|nr:hypothetical protein [Moorena sp. SIO3C2]